MHVAAGQQPSPDNDEDRDDDQEHDHVSRSLGEERKRRQNQGGSEYPPADTPKPGSLPGPVLAKHGARVRHHSPPRDFGAGFISVARSE